MGDIKLQAMMLLRGRCHASKPCQKAACVRAPRSKVTSSWFFPFFFSFSCPSVPSPPLPRALETIDRCASAGGHPQARRKIQPESAERQQLLNLILGCRSIVFAVSQNVELRRRESRAQPPMPIGAYLAVVELVVPPPVRCVRPRCCCCCRCCCR